MLEQKTSLLQGCLKLQADLLPPFPILPYRHIDFLPCENAGRILYIRI
jgi:hypothetical protein